MTTDEERLEEILANIKASEELLREEKESLRYLRMEYRTLLQQMASPPESTYQQARGCLKADT